MYRISTSEFFHTVSNSKEFVVSADNVISLKESAAGTRKHDRGELRSLK